MTRILVAYASKHGATEELARSIGTTIGEQGFAVDVRPVGEIDDLERYDALVLGSAVYMGAWLESARKLVDERRDAIRARPTWLFSSGPIGGEDTVGSIDVTELVATTNARDHHLFGGRLDRSTLTPGERFLARLLRADDGDFREWDAAVAWGTAIARTLTAANVA